MVIFDQNPVSVIGGRPEQPVYYFEEREPYGLFDVLGAESIDVAAALASIAEVRPAGDGFEAIIPAPRGLLRVVQQAGSTPDGRAAIVAAAGRRADLWGYGPVAWDGTASLCPGFARIGLRRCAP